MSATVKVNIYKYKRGLPVLVDEGVDVTCKQLLNLVDASVYRVLYFEDGTVCTRENVFEKFYGGSGGGGGSDTEWVINVDKSKLDWETDVYTGDHPTFEEFVEGLKNGKSRLVVNCINHEASGAAYGVCNSSVKTQLTNSESYGSDEITWYIDTNGGSASDRIMARIDSDNVMKLYWLGMD